VVGLLQVLVIHGELAAEWTRGTGLASFLSLAAGDAVAAVVLVAAFAGVRRDRTAG
jgi:hypothetical protein